MHEWSSLLESMINVRYEALAFGWSISDDGSLVHWIRDRLEEHDAQREELELLRQDIAELREIAIAHGWSEDDDDTPYEFLDLVLADWETSIRKLEQLAERYKQKDDPEWMHKRASDYIEALLHDAFHFTDISNKLSISSRAEAASCKNCKLELYCATRRDAYMMTGNSGHLDNDDLVFQALADSCTIYARRIDER